MFLSAGASVAILLLGAVAAAVALVLHARLQSELIEISARHRQASEHFKRVHADAAAIRGEADGMGKQDPGIAHPIRHPGPAQLHSRRAQQIGQRGHTPASASLRA